MKSRGRIITITYVVIEVFLLGISQLGYTCLVDEMHYVCVVLCFLFRLGRSYRNHNVSRDLILLALGFTCVADYFLIIKNQHYEVGVTAFIATQICYFVFLAANMDSSCQKTLWRGRMGSAVVLVIAALLALKQFSLLLMLVPVYVVFFVDNIRIAGMQFKRYRLLFLGLVLFFCCDICVGMANADLAEIQIPYQNVFAWLIWLFYIPSQICISFVDDGKKLEKMQNI